MPLSTRVYNALTAAVSRFTRVYADPETEQTRRGWASRAAEYRALWAWYNNSVFEDLDEWAEYRSRYRLPRHIRAIYNPTRRLVDFYASVIYPGVLSDDGDELPGSAPIAIPLPSDTDPALRKAIAQLWRWSNWQSGMGVMVRYGAALGNAFTEVVDDVARGKVYLVNHWPGLVADLDLDAQRNVKSYALEYLTSDRDGGPQYTYRKEVNAETIRTLKNGELFDYSPDGSVGAEYANPYGFAPAVWTPHLDLGGEHGAPAIHGALGKLDELNSTASLVHDQVRKLVGGPLVFWTDDSLEALAGRAKRGRTTTLTDPYADKEDLMWIKGGSGGRVEHLSAGLDFSGALAVMRELMGEIEQDFPELTYFRQMRAMSTVTGPAAARLAGDVTSRVFQSAANYDVSSVKLFQMGVAIAGWRLSQGDWPSPSAQQNAFLGFGLDSYANGDLDFSIAPRPLVVTNDDERAATSMKWWQAAQAATTAGLPLDVFLARERGWRDEEVGAIDEAKRHAAELEKEINPPPPPPPAPPTGTN